MIEASQIVLFLLLFLSFVWLLIAGCHYFLRTLSSSTNARDTLICSTLTLCFDIAVLVVNEIQVAEESRRFRPWFKTWITRLGTREYDLAINILIRLSFLSVIAVQVCWYFSPLGTSWWIEGGVLLALPSWKDAEVVFDYECGKEPRLRSHVFSSLGISTVYRV